MNELKTYKHFIHNPQYVSFDRGNVVDSFAEPEGILPHLGQTSGNRVL